MTKLCKLCHNIAMRPHPELYYWFKCPICAYCEFNLEWLHPDKRETAAANKYAKLPDLMVQELYKNRIIWSTS